MRKALVIVNPIAGSGKGEKFYKRISGYGLHLIRTTPKVSAAWIAKQAIKEGYRFVAVAGGDGTVREVGEVLAETDVTMGIVPLGNGNDTSKGLGIPQDPQTALDLFLLGGIRTVPIDVGVVNGRKFINSVSFGLDARIVHHILPIKKIYRKMHLPAEGLYLAAALWELLWSIDYPEVSLGFPNNGKLGMPGRPTTILAVANGPQYGGKFKIAPRANFTDGKLDICWIGKMDKLKIVTCLSKLMRGVHEQLPEVDAFKMPDQSFSIRSSAELVCQMDGEIVETSQEYHIGVIPRALNVAVPSSVAELIRVPLENSVPQPA